MAITWKLPMDLFWGLGIMHLSIGAIAAKVAYTKGRQLSRWLPLGLIAGTPALIAALLLPSVDEL